MNLNMLAETQSTLHEITFSELVLFIKTSYNNKHANMYSLALNM